MERRCNFYQANTNCRAEVTQNKDANTGLQYIGIKISGENLDNKKELFSKIREQVDYIHKTAFSHIKYDEIIFCNCPKCESLEEPSFYTKIDLKEYVEEGSTHIECRKLKRSVPIANLLGAVYPYEIYKKMIEDYERKSGDTYNFHNYKEVQQQNIAGLKNRNTNQ